MPRGISGPWHFSMHSNPYDLVLFLVLWGVMGFYLLVEFKLDVLIKRLPELQTLDLFSYRMILVAFPLLLLVIVTGAIWAHYSWGRYWGWDPKETWSLITWTIYALYLHTRITRGWVGRPSAIIAVVGFLMVIFTYLGVNLGLTGSGLHTYGSE